MGLQQYLLQISLARVVSDSLVVCPVLGFGGFHNKRVCSRKEEKLYTNEQL